MKKVRKIIGIILLVVLGVLVVIGAAVGISASANTKAMNACIEETLALAKQDHTVTEIPAGEYQEMTAMGILKFHVKQYDIEGVGNLSTMTVNAGVMQMATIVFTPMEKDIPLLSCDYMYILGNRKSYLELYDLVNDRDDVYDSWLSEYQAVQDRYAAIPDTEASDAWYTDLLTVVTYKAGKKSDDAALQQLLLDTVGVYLDQADAYAEMPTEAKAAKRELIKNYSDGLIDQGGVSTDFFTKSFGTDTTRDFFDRVFFGTAQSK